ncbi:dioxygenase family protein [Mycobacterium kansasii]|uniref:Dioxygenase family protein n=1 Tax=Mycobacterium kansasii TaxID=1768 RepID=A0A1V3XRW3_MYCKA|nr:dioxygenase family protein [Mycobacterium kansasii]
MAELACTPGQTVGPFFGIALSYPGDSQLVADEHPDAIGLHGTVYDGAGAGVPDALLELWQADGAGRIPRQAGSLRRAGAGLAEFTGFGRAATDADGHYRFTTVAPGSVDGRAPFFVIAVFARACCTGCSPAPTCRRLIWTPIGCWPESTHHGAPRCCAPATMLRAVSDTVSTSTCRARLKPCS